MAGLAAVEPRIPPGIDRADVRLRQNPPLDPRDGEVLAGKALVLARAHVQDADVLRARLAGDLCAEIDPLGRTARAQPDLPTEERNHLVVLVPAPAEVEPALAVAAEVEEGRAVEEEIASLGKKERKARQVDLTLVDFRLGEVGVDGEDGPQQRSEAVEEIDSRAGVARDCGAAAPRRCLRREDPVRLDVEAVALRHVADAGHQASVAHPAQPLVARPSHPEALLVLAPDRALKVDAPGVAVRVEVQRAERNLDLECPADLAALMPRIPDPIPLAIVAVDAQVRIGH